MSSKLPAFQFYPGDWRKDPGVQALDFEARGVWFEILCLMHESERRGVLLLAGKAMPDDALARLLGIDPVLLKQILSKIEAYGVAGREQGSGALMSRRMVRDESIRSVRAKAGHLGGKQRLLKQNSSKIEAGFNQTAKQNRPPSSSSSTSVNIGTHSRASEDESGQSGDNPSSPSNPQTATPTMAQVKSAGLLAGAGPDCSEAFFHEMEACGWIDSRQRPIRNWRAALSKYAISWRSNEHQRSAKTSSRPAPTPAQSRPLPTAEEAARKWREENPQ